MTTDNARLRERLQRREERARVRAEAHALRNARRARQRVSRIRQRALLAGEAARTRHAVDQSGEARALRLARTRTVALAALLPVLCAFGFWSAAGVQAGMVTLLSLEPDSAAAAAAWLVEPALIGVVAGVILIRARLRSVGGDLDERASRIEWGALSLSILLNCVGHWPNSLDATAFAALAGHALGPIGAAGTAYLISVVQDGISSADPWHLDGGSPAPSLVDVEEVEAGQERPESSSGEVDQEPFVWPVALPDGVRLLPLVAASETPLGEVDQEPFVWPVALPDGVRLLPLGEVPVTSPVNLTERAEEAPTGSTGAPSVNLTDDTEEPSPVNLTKSPVNAAQSVSETPSSDPRESKPRLRKRRTRSSRRSTSPVNRKTVEERARELDALIRSGALTEASSVNRVRLALSCSPENARRAIEWRREHLTGEPVEEVTGEPDAASPVNPPVESGDPVDDPTGEATEVVIDPNELTVEQVLTAAR